MTAAELEAAIARRTEGLARRPGPNDLSVKHVSIARVDGDFAETVERRWVPSERIPVAAIVLLSEAYAAIGVPTEKRAAVGNYLESETLCSALEAAVGSEPDDGIGKATIMLSLGQLRRLVAMLARPDGTEVKP
jgi:hypothetical protein